VETALASQAAVVRHWASALHRFTRPHTMLGTLVSVVSVSLLAVGSQGMTPVAVTALAQSLSSALLMNICIVGINQVRGPLMMRKVCFPLNSTHGAL